MSDEASTLRIGPGAPARWAAAAIPLAACALVTFGASRGAMEPGVDSPVSPWVVAVLTIVGSIVLSWRSLTQEAILDDEELVCRNLTSTVRLHWSAIEELRCMHRSSLLLVEIHLRGSRRRLRIGAATRPLGADADAVVALLAAHRRAGALLEREAP